jgi:ferritin-like protein
MKLYHSIKESEIFGIKIGRAERIYKLDCSLLKQEIREGAYDQVRLKVDASDKDLLRKLDALGVYYVIYNVIQHLRLEMSDYNLKEISGCTFIPYTEEWKDKLKEMVYEVQANPTGINYSSLFQPTSSEENEKKAAFEFIHSNSLDPTSDFRTILCKDDLTDEVVGYHFYTIRDPAYVFLMGTIGKARNKGFAKKLHTHSFNLAKLAGCKWFESDVPIQNDASMNACMHAGFKPAGIFLNVILYPYLSLRTAGVNNSSISGNNIHDIMIQCQKELEKNDLRQLIFKVNIIDFDETQSKTGPFICLKQSTLPLIDGNEKTVIDTYKVFRDDQLSNAVYIFSHEVD